MKQLQLVQVPKKALKKTRAKLKGIKKVLVLPKQLKKIKETEETEPTLQDLASNNTGRNVLREKTTNEQVQDSDSENVVLNNTEPNNTEQENREPDTINKDNPIHQLTNNQSSFIWKYLEKLSPSEKYKKRAKCLVPVIGLRGEQLCGYVMGTDSSTGNFIQHLAKHCIIRDIELSKDNAESIEKMRYIISNPVRKN